MSNNLTIAKEYCCNYWSGNCLGAMTQRKDGVLYMWLDEKLHGNPCVADKECNYFETIVIKSIQDEKPKKRKRI
tara:strand:- start:4602 stop:4823 length:222 start_codon:yes stop_codon:yes gene_type:complete